MELKQNVLPMGLKTLTCIYNINNQETRSFKH